MSFTCSISHVGSVATVKPVGDIDFPATGDFRQTLQAAGRDPEITTIVVDLSGVTFVDSTALGLFVAAHSAAERQGHTFALSNPGPMAAMVLKVTGLFDVLVMNDPAEATA